MIIHVIHNGIFFLLIATSSRLDIKNKMNQKSRNFENVAFFNSTFLNLATFDDVVRFNKFLIVIVIIVEKYYDKMICTILVRASHEIFHNSLSKKRLFFVVNLVLLLMLSEIEDL